MAVNGRRSADERLILELAAGRPIAAAAEAAGVGERTAYRRLEDPAFQQRVADVRSAFVKQALAKLSESSSRAVETLVALLDAENHSVRLGAARTILDVGMKLRESVEMEQRLRRLEQARDEKRNEIHRRQTGAA